MMIMLGDRLLQQKMIGKFILCHKKLILLLFRKHFKKEEIASIKCGHIPREMEDRQFCYFEDNKLYIHRSWSGICIYIVEFNFIFNRHKVTVNRDDQQYACNDIKEDIEKLEFLLNLWT